MYRDFPTRGSLLLEVVIGSALLALLMAVSLQVILPSLRLTGRSSVRTGLQQQAILVFTRLERNLRRSSDFGIGLHQPSAGQPLLLSVHRLETPETAFGGSPRWEPALLLYVFQQKILSEVYFSAAQSGLPLSAAAPFRCDGGQLLGLLQKPPTRRSLLAREVSEFQVDRDSSALFTISLTLSGDSYGAPGPTNFHLVRTFAPRNR